MWQATVLSLFPEMFPGPLGFSLAGRALETGVWSLDAVDIRRFARDRHGTVDDTPFGGGAGMVMRPDVLSDAIAAVTAPERPTIYLSPRGRLFDQTQARTLAAGAGVTLVCGRFEGIDERVIEAYGLEEVSIGDVVLSGGEIAAYVVLDACVRLLPGVVGTPQSLAEESFEEGLLEYPLYTRPAAWTGPDGIERVVPDILQTGHHAKIAAWRREKAEEITRQRRPDLWARYVARRVEGLKNSSERKGKGQ